jgi:hypothetical protein
MLRRYMAGMTYVDPSSILYDMPVEVRFLALKNAWQNKGAGGANTFKMNEDALFSCLDMHTAMYFAGLFTSQSRMQNKKFFLCCVSM